MSRYAVVAVLAVVLHPHLTAGGVSVPLAGPLAVLGLVAAACAVVAVLAVRALHRFTSCPHLRTVAAAP